MSAYLILLLSPMIALVAVAVLGTSYRTNSGKIDLTPEHTPNAPPVIKRPDTDAPFLNGAPPIDDFDSDEELTPLPSCPDSAPPAPVKRDDGAVPGLIGARLVDLNGTYKRHSFPIPPTGVTIGRSPYVAEIVLGNPCISSRHAWIGFVDGRPMLRDLNSTNGTFLNGRVILPVGDVALTSGDTVVFAAARGERFRFEIT